MKTGTPAESQAYQPVIGKYFFFFIKIQAITSILSANSTKILLHRSLSRFLFPVVCWENQVLNKLLLVEATKAT
ncbi:MAG: hypothetical protein FDX17_01165 [Chlorobium sp.]|nr:MAG: hypothetical protein FDX17_01165 [Chlorobium sp.]